jgi:hypothetical protein
MSRNRKRHANAIEVGSLTKWIVAAFFLGVTGLSYVYLKNQLQSTGKQIAFLERKVSELGTQEQAVRAEIGQLSSHSALQRKLTEGFIKMIPITDDRIVRINPVGPRGGEGDLRQISNQETAK